MKKINYIIACYFGPRRAQIPEIVENPFIFIEKHIQQLNKIADKNISKVTFVVNPYKSSIDNQIYKKAESLNLKNYEIIIRKENKGFSYAGWHDIILKNLSEDYDYFMLMEDDYAPNIFHFTECFLKKFVDDTAAVFMKYDYDGCLKKHASVSNGVLAVSACKEIFDKYGEVFLLNNDTTYEGAEQNQINFMNYFEQEGRKICDISDDCGIPFMNLAEFKLFGNKDGIVAIKPIAAEFVLNSYQMRKNNLFTLQYTDSNFSFIKMEQKHIPFYNKIRNNSRTNLHDDSSYTVEQTTEWFVKTKPLFYIIEKDGVEIGYFRTSSYSEKNRNMYIGADLDSAFRGNGLAFEAYLKFIPFIFEEFDLNKVYGEVLSNNEISLKLCKKVGFIIEGIKKKDVNHNGVFIDSVLMSIMRDDWYGE